MNILQQRQLDLPPGWKYLFVEVQPEASVSRLPINFMALHVAPPKITTKRIANILSDITTGKAQGFSDLSILLADYKKQVVLQGSQVSVALAAIKTFKDPTLVVGDFNTTRDSAIHLELRKTLVDTWSEAGWGFGASRYWGSFLPLRIDYIYASREFSVQSSETIASDCSDHLPVVSEVFLDPDLSR
jgi:endonuclease/exonuclease/phosphatase family metal-dependent hydrolase